MKDENTIPEYNEWHEAHEGTDLGPNPNGIITTGGGRRHPGLGAAAETGGQGGWPGRARTATGGSAEGAAATGLPESVSLTDLAKQGGAK